MRIKSLYFNAENLIRVFNPLNQHKVAEDKVRAYTGVSPTLISIKNTFDKKALDIIIIAQLENLNDFCGVNYKMEASTMIELSNMIQTRYYYLKIAELLLFFFNFKMGYYGELYGAVDPIKITSALNKFMIERNNDLNTIEKEVRKTEPLKTQGANIVRGLDAVRELSKKAKTDYKAFRELFPKLPGNRANEVYWRAWRLFESVGRMLCEFNIKNK